MKYIVDMTLEVEETMALNVERSNSTNLQFVELIKSALLYTFRCTVRSAILRSTKASLV